ncbi:MAG: PKD domain-containing protein, partial [Elusimicrobia bacterium]|nr:PKD domain-containing protein [Candidatus Liberimonas magnetica]
MASFTAAPTTGQAPLTVSFNASASSDPDGSITSYSW